MTLTAPALRFVGRTTVIAAVALVTALAMAPSAWAAIGENFSIAPMTANGTSAPAFPDDPDVLVDRAFWAGVCDMHAGTLAVGVLPSSPSADCIEHPAATASFNNVTPPLAAGVDPDTSGPDGWIVAGPSGGNTLTTGPGWRFQDAVQAGAHPDATTTFWFSRNPEQLCCDQDRVLSAVPGPDGAPRNITVAIPHGVVGNPNAVPKCPAEALSFVPVRCSPKTQIGTSTVQVGGSTAVYPVYNVERRRGNTAEFVISRVGKLASNNSNVAIVARARTERSRDFGVSAGAVQVPAGLVLTAQTFTIWGVPWAASHDNYRPVSGYCGAPNADSSGGAKSTFGMPVSGLPGGFAGPEGGCTQEPQSYDPSWGPIRPFFTTQTWCEDPKPTTEIVADNWHTDVVGTATSGAPQPSDCGALPFDASLDVQATSTKADGPTGLDVDLTVQQNNDPPAAVRFNPDDDSGAPAYWKAPQGRATSHLDETVVTLPDGVSVNPAGADGLVGCTDQQVGLLREGVDGNGVGGGFGIDEGIEWSTEDPLDGSGVVECPPASILGVARVRSGLLDLPLDGHLILGAPKSTDPASGRMFRMFLVVRSAEQGLLVKLLGSAVADPRTGRLTVRFDENPQLPFDEVNVDVKGGDNAVLALQQRCDSRPWATELRPWSRNAPVVEGGGFVTQTNCGFDFAPSLEAGMSSRSAGGSGSFSFTFSRTDGQQWFQGLTAELPPGLLASVKDVPLCSNAQVDAFVNNQEAAGRPVGQPCSAASRIGTVDAGAGSGAPYFLETKGSAYLTEGYKGGEYGLAVVVPVEAGPFKGASALKTIVVRQALHVDRTDASVTAVSDPLPQIWHGIPLRVRQATVRVDRPGFMRNPTGCSLKSIRANFVSAEGVSATRDSPFQVTGCGSLSFKPKLALRLTGRKQVTTGKHPGIRAQVTQRGGEAGVKKAVVRLPKSLALDVNNAQSLCEFADGIKDDLENHCPKGSIVGRARAVSPLLKEPLAGDVFFVKNVRIDPRTGNEIRTLPMIIVALRGEVAINLRGVSSTTKNGRLVNTFDKVPDAPIERFNLNIAGGKNGIIAVTRTKRARINLCSKSQRQVAEADFDGQNGKRHDRDIRMTTPCKKRAAKRPTARKRAVADSR